jgi:glyoxylase-like metal-dependent hydrolase (beta-lactamase superfamily II)
VSGWFHVAELEPGVALVAEPGHVCSWLIRGNERSVLLDTGLGVADIAAAVAAVSAGPVEVVNSHSHFDHVGGNALFEQRAIHRLGGPLLAAGCPPDLLAAYATASAGIRSRWDALKAADGAGFHVLGPDEEVRPWPPPGFDPAEWRIEAPPPTQLLDEGDVIELGARSLRVLHTPGHSPDHICLLDEEAGILFAQDQAYYGPHLLYFEDSSIEEWARSLRRLAEEVQPQVRVVYCAHCLRPAVPPRLLTELADAAEAVIAGEVPLVQRLGFLGARVRGADFGHFSLLLPATPEREDDPR